MQQILKPAGDEDSCSVLMSCGEIVLQNLRATYGIRLRRAVNSIKREVAGFFFFFFLTVFVKMFLRAGRHLRLQRHRAEDGYLTTLTSSLTVGSLKFFPGFIHSDFTSRQR